jgi:hypothetical protein
MHVVAMLEVGNMPGAQKYWPLSYANVKVRRHILFVV